ncbi:MAG: hypothetical protein CG439_1577 [Methylococcaceae bacterium NSP1-2]|nr:hypothetical protein [Methylococcaceae bacterium]MDD1616451.1 hypothetical protein [Methylococcaceae bacterium]OYV17702.1 MAG: hypothetical protein CG439_1577 [Methylococcaceae bacterium NSP1-2]
MNNNAQLVTCDDDGIAERPELEGFFSLRSTGLFWCNAEVLQSDEALEKLVFLIAKKPKCLINHVRRIYYCFQKNLNDQLFAAIVDFLVILNQQGQAISWRVVLGAKSRLTPEQFQELKGYLKDDCTDINRLTGNQYSVFSKGLVGINKMIQQIEKEEKTNDPLIIALDHIQYSQLDEAKEVLEEGILIEPERLDLRQELFDLYKLTGDSNRFHQMLAKLTRLGIIMTDDWNQLNNYFKGQNNNG